MSALKVIKEFYQSRQQGDPSILRPLIADTVVWREPDVEHHMGEIMGVDAVLDMMTRALATTGGTFSLGVAEAIEVEGHCSAVIEWTAEKNGSLIKGRELASFSVKDGKIVFAQFLPENLSNDEAFWA